MAKANRVHSTPRRTAPKIQPQKPIERHAQPACPVVDLSQQLMDIWDADDASQREYQKDKILKAVGDSVKEQVEEWQSALVRIISFTEAKSPAGAMVQMALALAALLRTDSGERCS